MSTPNGWRHNREWHNAHYFRSGRALCGLDAGTMPTTAVNKRQVVQRCGKCRDEYSEQMHLINRQGRTVLDLIGYDKGAPMA